MCLGSPKASGKACGRSDLRGSRGGVSPMRGLKSRWFVQRDTAWVGRQPAQPPAWHSVREWALPAGWSRSVVGPEGG